MYFYRLLYAKHLFTNYNFSSCYLFFNNAVTPAMDVITLFYTSLRQDIVKNIQTYLNTEAATRVAL